MAGYCNIYISFRCYVDLYIYIYSDVLELGEKVVNLTVNRGENLLIVIFIAQFS